MSENKNKGFLLIDQQRNTIFIPWDNLKSNNHNEYDLIYDYLMYSENLKKKVKQHHRFTDLISDIRAYINGKYEDHREG